MLATDRAAVADFQAFCRETGHALIAWSEEKGGVFSFVIRRRRPIRPPMANHERATMSTALITHPACLGHDPGAWHPECPDRLRAVLRALEHPDFVHLLRESAPEATVEQLTRVHPANYVDAILAIRPAAGRTGAARRRHRHERRQRRGRVAGRRRRRGGRSMR